MTSDTAMVLLTAVSVAAALLAIGIARSARDEANRANVLSTSANGIARGANQLAEDSNSIAKDAVDTARAVPTEVAWDEALVAIAALQNANPTDPREQVGPLLTTLRTRVFLLVDRLSWQGFDDWAAHEYRRGVLLMREALECGQRAHADGRRLTIEEVLIANDQFSLWVVAFTSNLRRFRRVGFDPKSMDELTADARSAWKAIEARNRWPETPESIPGLVPLTDPAEETLHEQVSPQQPDVTESGGGDIDPHGGLP